MKYFDLQTDPHPPDFLFQFFCDYEAHLSSAAHLMLTWHANLTRCLSDLLTPAGADLEVITLSSRALPEKVSFVVLSANVQQ